MKQNLLLVSTAMLSLVGTGAYAQSQWTLPKAPASTPVALDGTESAGAVQYLFNVGYGGFFLGANDWGTRASIGATGIPVRFVKKADADTYGIRNLGNNQYVSPDGTTSIWIDGGRNAFADWTITQEGDYIVIKNATTGAGSLGVLSTATGTPKVDLIAEVPEGATLYDKWILVDEETYKAYVAENEAWLNTCFTALTLGKAIADGKAAWPNVDYAAEEAVYANVASTIAELNDAIKSVTDKSELAKAFATLDKAIKDGKTAWPDVDFAAEEAVCGNSASTLAELNAASKSVADKCDAAQRAYDEQQAAQEALSATPSNPKNFSNLIVNPTFDNITYEGWEGTKFGSGGTVGPCAERYSMNYETWQIIKNLPNGVYAVKASGFYRAGITAEAFTAYTKGINQNAFLYAVNLVDEADASKNDTLQTPLKHLFDGIKPGENADLISVSHVDGDLTYYVPNTMAGAVSFMDKGFYADNTVMIAVTNGTIKIGGKKGVTINSDWSIFDNFQLIYYGNSAEAYQMWMDQASASVKDFSKEANVTPAVLEAYNKEVAAAKTAATREEVLANIAKIEEACKTVEANIAAWKELTDAYNRAKDITGSDDYQGDAIEDLADYVMEVESVFKKKNLSTEQILKEAATLDEMRKDAVENSLQPGKVFSQLVNPDFGTGDWTGWNHLPASVPEGHAMSVNASAKCAEAWNMDDFDIYQIVEGAPVGVYSISMQGFYRQGRGEAAYNLYYDEFGEKKENSPQSTAFVYMNDAKTPLANVFDYKVPFGEIYKPVGTNDPYVTSDGAYWFPNNMTDAGLAFDEGAYEVKAYGLVAKKGDVMRVGVKGRSNELGDSWAIFDNFKLVYEGFAPEVVKPILEKESASLDAKGMVGSDVAAQCAKVKEAATTALAGTDGKTMFDALASVYEAQNAIDASKAIFETLVKKNEALSEALGASTAAKEVKDEATALYSTTDKAISDASYTDAQASEAIAKIDETISALKIPAEANEASDEAPVDLTMLIASPTFETVEGANTVEGWSGASGYNFGNDATQKSALCLEYFEKTYDMYQDITGLPEGTYEISVNAFYRYTSVAEDQARLDSGEGGLATMYAVSGESTVEKSVALLTSDPSTEKFESGVENSFVKDDVTYYVPNDMVSSAAYFVNDKYINSIIVKVTDGKLRIGVKQTESVAGGWMIMDNWKLTYYGKNSSRGEATAIDEVAEATVAKVEMFSATGAKVSAIQQGITIVRTTMTDGSVVVKKVIKK